MYNPVHTDILKTGLNCRFFFFLLGIEAEDRQEKNWGLGVKQKRNKKDKKSVVVGCVI